ncbi:uncharacterized protein F4807DRAFT_61778 [Annulohypoxylon truncatum]|uniref:uncharacterized protein n=1 Tax=Annulohypoxylon truncatum TaxID=327061 RepID=UPI002007678B|nr:uncharacterized protein F4807DRAFT_61778 [Annulohypoxylon truncatum]KAI1210349.1 hypothetical protein F4807DRAFT_61778 [Annulohypoxylon truncatum]
MSPTSAFFFFLCLTCAMECDRNANKTAQPALDAQGDVDAAKCIGPYPSTEVTRAHRRPARCPMASLQSPGVMINRHGNPDTVNSGWFNIQISGTDANLALNETHPFEYRAEGGSRRQILHIYRYYWCIGDIVSDFPECRSLEVRP